LLRRVLGEPESGDLVAVVEASLDPDPPGLHVGLAVREGPAADDHGVLLQRPTEDVVHGDVLAVLVGEDPLRGVTGHVVVTERTAAVGV